MVEVLLTCSSTVAGYPGRGDRGLGLLGTDPEPPEGGIGGFGRRRGRAAADQALRPAARRAAPGWSAPVPRAPAPTARVGRRPRCECRRSTPAASASERPSPSTSSQARKAWQDTQNSVPGSLRSPHSPQTYSAIAARPPRGATFALDPWAPGVRSIASSRMGMSSVIQFTHADRGFGAVCRSRRPAGRYLASALLYRTRTSRSANVEGPANSAGQVVANSRWR